MKVVSSLFLPSTFAALVGLTGLIACEKPSENNAEAVATTAAPATAEASAPTATKPAAAAPEGATTLTLAVEGMVCGGCEQAIGDRVGAMDGVTSCVADHKAGTAKVVFDPTKTDATKIASTIDALGYKSKVKP